MECYDDYYEAYNSDLSPFPEVRVDDKDIQDCIDFDEMSDYGKYVDTLVKKNLVSSKLRFDYEKKT